MSARTVTKAIAARKLAVSPIKDSWLNIPASGFATHNTPNKPTIAASNILAVIFSFKNNHAINGIKMGEEEVKTIALDKFKWAMA